MTLASYSPMTDRDLKERTRDLVQRTLGDSGEPEIERVLVGDAVVARDGDHYRIESGGDDDAELATRASRTLGRCDCGEPLSGFNDHQRCRTCGREYRSGS